MPHCRRHASSMLCTLLSATIALCLWSGPAYGQGAPAAQATDDPHRTDRGTGVPTSMFGTYVRGGEWLVYPFVEHYRDNNFE